MRKIYSSLLAVAFVAMLAPSCESMPGLDLPSTGEVTEITFKSAIETRATDTEFESGDEIYVTAYLANQPLANDVSYTFNGSIFEATDQAITKTEDLSYGYKAIYPALSTKSGSITFAAKSDQSTASGYTLSDLMTSNVAATDAEQPKLTFDHLMTKVVLNITSDVELVGAVITAKGEVKYDTLSNEVETTDSSATQISMKEVKPGSDYTDSYEVIVAPQSVENMEIQISSADAKYTVTYDDASQMASGYVYTATINVEDDTAEIVNVEFSGDINDWVGGGDLNTGATMQLLALSADSYPAKLNTWIITDKSATAADFKGLHDALETLSESGRKISLEFPNLEAIPDYAIFGEESYTSGFLSNALVSVKADVATYIGTNAFSYCDALTTIELPNVTEVREFSLYRNNALTKISLPKAETIGECALCGCNSLVSFEVAESVIHLGGGAFNDCQSLTDLKMLSKNFIYEDGVIYYAAGCSLFENDKEHLISALCAVMPVDYYSNSVKFIDNFALRFCHNLRSVDIPNAVSINYYSIANCYALGWVSLPALEMTSDCSFYLCDKLAYANLPSVSIVLNAAFGRCNSLTYLCLAANEGVKLNNIDSTAFSSVDTKQIDLELGAENLEFVNPTDLTLNVGDFSAPFKSITVDHQTFEKSQHSVDISQFSETASEGEQSVVIDGITFNYSDTYYNSSYGSITTLPYGYIYNETELLGLREVRIVEDWKYFNYTFLVGDSLDNLSAQEITYTKEGNDYIYSIPEGYNYFILYNQSDYDASCDQILLTFDSIGAAPDVPDDPDVKPDIIFGSEVFSADVNYTTEDTFVFTMNCSAEISGYNYMYTVLAKSEFEDAENGFGGDINEMADDLAEFLAYEGVNPQYPDNKYVFSANGGAQMINPATSWMINPGEEHIVALFVINENGDRISEPYSFSVQTGGEHQPLNEEYKKWLGNWEVNCMGDDGNPISMDISITPCIDDYSFYITGLDISEVRLAYSATALFSMAGGDGGVTESMIYTLANEVLFYFDPNEGMSGRGVYGALCTVDDLDGYTVVNGSYSALSGSMESDGLKATLTGYEGELTDGRSFMVQNQTLMYENLDDGGFSLYNNDPAYTEGVYPTGPYELTKISELASAPVRVSRGVVPNIFKSTLIKSLNAPISVEVGRALIQK